MYVDKLFTIYAYDAEQPLLSLTFIVVAGEEFIDNYSWFIQWLCTEVIDDEKIIVVSYQHLGITIVFERLNFE
jgi:hypothetical protein